MIQIGTAALYACDTYSILLPVLLFVIPLSIGGSWRVAQRRRRDFAEVHVPRMAVPLHDLPGQRVRGGGQDRLPAGTTAVRCALCRSHLQTLLMHARRGT